MTAAVETINLTKSFGTLTAVDALNLTVQTGTIFGLLGPNGAGKTTTIRMLTTLLPPTSGTGIVAGYDVVREAEQVRESIGYVPQLLSTDGSLSGYENLLASARLYHLPRGERRDLIANALSDFGLSDAANRLVRTYSGGMIRRLEMAAAMLHKPHVLFLDEPTLGLDPQTRNHIWDYIRRLNAQRGITVFFTTHYMDEADRVAGQLAIIDRGKIVAQGAPAALKAQTQTATLEEAFIALTGGAIREEEASSADAMRAMGKMWGRR